MLRSAIGEVYEYIYGSKNEFGGRICSPVRLPWVVRGRRKGCTVAVAWPVTGSTRTGLTLGR